MHEKRRRIFIDFEAQIGPQNGPCLLHVDVKLDSKNSEEKNALQGSILNRFGVHFRQFVDHIRLPFWMIGVITF